MGFAPNGFSHRRIGKVGLSHFFAWYSAAVTIQVLGISIGEESVPACSKLNRFNLIDERRYP